MRLESTGRYFLAVHTLAAAHGFVGEEATPVGHVGCARRNCAILGRDVKVCSGWCWPRSLSAGSLLSAWLKVSCTCRARLVGLVDTLTVNSTVSPSRRTGRFGLHHEVPWPGDGVVFEQAAAQRPVVGEAQGRRHFVNASAW